MPEDRETYLGDGLYASFDGWQVKLRAPRPGPRITNCDEVYLELTTLDALLQFTRSVGWRVVDVQQA